ncbi:Fic family protein (plasmid) [Leifsonia sp. P73]|uniref:Fic family protein n=1 Tax=unclassified Leifsonia TaxID=2663824 RepID=UPI003704CBD3
MERLAHHYDQVNYLHPFREGNGRTQRIFWTQIAAGAGYDLDWSQATGAQNDHASRDAMERRDFAGLRTMFDRVVQPATPGGRLTPERLEQLRVFASMGGPAPRSRGISSTPARPTRSQTQGYDNDRGRGR